MCWTRSGWRMFSTGLVEGQLYSARSVRELRDLTRYRTSLIRERARTANRLQKVLEDANIKLAGVLPISGSVGVGHGCRRS